MNDAQSTPYLALGDTRRHLLAQHIGIGLKRWRQQWFDEQTPQVTVDVLEEGIPLPPGNQETLCFRAGTALRPALVLIIATRNLAALVGMAADRADVLGSFSPPGSLAEQLEHETLRRLVNEVLIAAGLDTTVLDRMSESLSEIHRRLMASRYIAARIALAGGNATFGMLVSPSLASALLPARKPTSAREPMERRSAALLPQVLDVHAELGHAQVALDELAALAVGDVIVLLEKLNDPGHLVIDGGDPVATFALGRLESQRAIRIESKQRKKD